jgi:hypothetical protein
MEQDGRHGGRMLLIDEMMHRTRKVPSKRWEINFPNYWEGRKARLAFP